MTEWRELKQCDRELSKLRRSAPHLNLGSLGWYAYKDPAYWQWYADAFSIPTADRAIVEQYADILARFLYLGQKIVDEKIEDPDDFYYQITSA